MKYPFMSLPVTNLKLKRLSDLGKKIDNVLSFFCLKYSSTRHAIPDPTKPVSRIVLNPIDDNLKYTTGSFIPYLEVEREDVINQLPAWDLKPNKKSLGRSADITKFDEAIIQNVKAIKREKYLRIKKYWAVAETLDKAVIGLTKEFGKGYRKSTVQAYYKYYSSALELSDDDVLVISSQKVVKRS